MTALYLISSLFFCVCIHFLLQSLSLHNTLRFSLNPPTVLLRFLSTVISFLGSILSFPFFRLASYIHISW